MESFLFDLYRAAPRLLPHESQTMAANLLDLVALAFNNVAKPEKNLPEESHLSALLSAQTFIRDRLHEPGLSPASIASALGTSRSNLYRMFEEHGGVAGYIREQRLRRCMTELISPHHAHRHIAEIAYAWGFSDPQNFARLFKRRFGRSPSEMRLTASLATPQQKRARRS